MPKPEVAKNNSSKGDAADGDGSQKGDRGERGDRGDELVLGFQGTNGKGEEEDLSCNEHNSNERLNAEEETKEQVDPSHVKIDMDNDQ